ncbi:MAG: radical SAM protein [Thermoplasmata archaeon]
MDIRLVACRTAASPSKLPGLDWAINPYRGCGHGCAYCYAQDVTRFEPHRRWGEVVEVKANIADRLRAELRNGARGVYGVGTVTDPYQPIENEHGLTRACLSVLRRADAEVSILTKSDLVLRDVDIMRGWPKVEVGFSIATLDESDARLVEPGAPGPRRRIAALRSVSQNGVRTYLMLAPVIVGLSDKEESLREVVRAAAEAGAGYIIWDAYNPKPLADARLRRALAAAGRETTWALDGHRRSRIHNIVSDECSAHGIRLMTAF